MKNGTIPSTLKVFVRSESEFKFRWDDIDMLDSKTTLASQIFVCNTENAKTQITAKSWAGGRRYNYTTKQYDVQEHIELDWENTPIKNIRIIDLVHRGNGGRAYYALINEKYVYDLREDVLLDTMLNCGIQENAVLNGEFIFATVGSQMKLIRVGSLLHDKLLETADFATKEYISDFEIGGIYQSKSKIILYLGEFTGNRVSIEYDTYDHDYSYGRFSGQSKRKVSTYINPKKKVFHVYCEIYKFMHDKIDYKTATTIFSKSRLEFGLNKMTSKAFKTKLATVKGSRESILNELKEYVTQRVTDDSYVSDMDLSILNSDEIGEHELVKKVIEKITTK